MPARKPAKEIRKQARAKAIDDACRAIRNFQDMVGWQEGESRNKTIKEIEDAVRRLKHE